MKDNPQQSGPDFCTHSIQYSVDKFKLLALEFLDKEENKEISPKMLPYEITFNE
ncbi:hypothetical protein TTHERM_000717599 (macronuclear) [Tetrahymena thermophila SB210]|uniref:Uncharacterized protein n=1 Tax=Tetrahymena thermophila (strain SB210) TaxID=312017 RepID=W7XIX1_TETTS|nr:hypothetical protein TTHERM_000717599 [Tetrahymena thermophila SB210]EWS73669.1 hypothetical protein TTHERM_000717599 [Tetrahymena thermophila SB210]|eukprot:XP_012653799.1 hypothetical protein TTHERM_000717599 [Tetrahymena thermophila SB210]